jgi:hypothetical protein
MLLLYINLLSFKNVPMSKGKRKQGNSLSSSQAQSGTYVDLFAIMVLFNFFTRPHLLLIYYFI